MGVDLFDLREDRRQRRWSPIATVLGVELSKRHRRRHKGGRLKGYTCGFPLVCKASQITLRSHSHASLSFQ